MLSSNSGSDSEIPSSSSDPTVSSTCHTRTTDMIGSNLSSKQKSNAEKSSSLNYVNLLSSSSSSDSLPVSPPKILKIAASTKSLSTASTSSTDPCINSTNHSSSRKSDRVKLPSSNYHELLCSSSSSDDLIDSPPKTLKVASSKKSSSVSSIDPTVYLASTAHTKSIFRSNLSPNKKRDGEKLASSKYNESFSRSSSSDDVTVSPPKRSKVAASKKSSSPSSINSSINLTSTARTTDCSPNGKSNGQKSFSSNYHTVFGSKRTNNNALIVSPTKRSKVAMSKRSPSRIKASSRHGSSALTSIRNTSSNYSTKHSSTTVASKALSPSQSGRKHLIVVS